VCVRGLKHINVINSLYTIHVARRVRAWIETIAFLKVL